MQRTLKPHGIAYHYRIDEDTPEMDETNFTIEEALTACACLKNAKDCDLHISRRHQSGLSSLARNGVPSRSGRSQPP